MTENIWNTLSFIFVALSYAVVFFIGSWFGHKKAYSEAMWIVRCVERGHQATLDLIGKHLSKDTNLL